MKCELCGARAARSQEDDEELWPRRKSRHHRGHSHYPLLKLS